MGHFPSGPVVKIPRSQCRGPRLHPWSGNEVPQAMPQLRVCVPQLISHAATKIQSATKEDGRPCVLQPETRDSRVNTNGFPVLCSLVATHTLHVIPSSSATGDGLFESLLRTHAHSLLQFSAHALTSTQITVFPSLSKSCMFFAGSGTASLISLLSASLTSFSHSQ